MIVPGSANSLLLAQGASTGYNLTKSLRFRSSASASLTRTPSVTGNQRTFTWSGWVKRGTLGVANTIFDAFYGGSTRYDVFYFTSSDTLRFFGGVYSTGSSTTTSVDLVTTQVFRDPSAWYHLILSVDTTQATTSNRVKIYVNGSQVTSFSTSTYPAQNDQTYYNVTTTGMSIGSDTANSFTFDGYMADVYSIDGQALTPSSFGENNATTGVWQPKRYTGTYGTNGFYLPFTDTSSTSPTGLGKDFSGASSNVIVGSATNASTTLTVVSTTGISVGNIVTGTGIPSNTYVTAIGVLQVTLSQAATSTTVSNNYTFSGNNWTCNNISLTAGSTYDSMIDVPTLTSATTANYCTWNAIFSGGTLSAGNLNSSNTDTTSNGTMAISSGKFYWEITVTAVGARTYIGVIKDTSRYTNGGWGANDVFTYRDDGVKYGAGSSTSYGATYTTGDVIGVALDMTGNTLTFYKNGTSQGTAFSSTQISGLTLIPMYYQQAGTGNSTANFGQQPFTYTPPTGYVALNTYNLPTSTIVKGNTVMDATIYTGTGASLSVTNAGFKPDLVWIKSRSAATDHKLTDSVRGTTKALISDTTGAETTDANGLTAFGTSGFTVGTDTVYNNNTATYVGWQWQAGQGTTSSNTNGSITSTVSVNPTAGFSIVKYSQGATNGTVGHGLGVAPSFIICRSIDNGGTSWITYQSVLGKDAILRLNTTDAYSTVSNIWGTSNPTSTVFGVGTAGSNSNNLGNVIAYCWAEIAGFSKAFSYTGNGSASGPFVYLGFRARYLMIKRTDSAGGWFLVDTARNPYNIANLDLFANTSDAEAAINNIDILSNGFRPTDSNSGTNANGGTFVGMAFAENPFKNALAR